MNDNDRIKILNFLQWNDRNGCYTDENCDLEEVPRMTYEEAIKYAKENNIYESTMNKLQILINAKSADDELYRSILD